MAAQGSARAGQLLEKVQGPVRGALLGAFLTAAVLLAFGWLASGWYEQRLIAELRVQITEELSLRAQALSSAVYRRFVLVEGLHAFTETELGSVDFEEKFQLFSSRLHTSTRGIRNIAIGPQGTMLHVYPSEGNEQVIGYNPLNDPRPEVRADAQRAIETRSIVLSGPHELVQGGTGLIVREAVFQDGSFWGLVNVVMDLQPVLDRAGLDGSAGDLDIALRDSSGKTLYGPAEVFERNPVLHRIILEEGGEWELAGLPQGGWQAAAGTQLRIFQSGSLVIILLVTSLVYLSINRQSRLRLTVRERTREISQVNEQLVTELAERRRIEANLRASEERLASLLDVAPDAIIAVDEDQKISVFNKAAETMFGYPAAEVLGEPLGVLLPERFTTSHARHIEAFLEQPVSVRRMDERLPIWGRRRDGGEFPAEASISKLAEDGSITLTAIVRDISLRKKAEENLRASESRNRALLNAIPDLILRIGRDGTYLDVHAEKETDLLPLDLAIGANLRSSTIPPELAGRMMGTIEKVIRKNTIETVEYSLDLPQGAQTFEARMVKSGEDEVVAILRNITERKLAEETLRESQQRYEQLVHTIDGIVWEGDAHTFQYYFVSQQAERLLGYPVERWVNEPAFWIDHIYPEDREWAVNFCTLSTARKQDHEFEYRMVAADGRLVWLRDIVTVVLENDRPVTLRGVMVDITESKRFEAELREREELLEERVAQRTNELQTLLEISRNLSSSLDLQTLLSTVFEQLKNVVDFTTLTVWMVENEDEFVVVDYQGPLPQDRDYSRWKQPDEHREVVNLARIKEPLVIPDVSADSPLAEVWQVATSALLGEVPTFAASWMGIPLIVKDRLIGMFTFNHEQPNYYTSQHAELALALANHTAVAIENARLFHTVQRGAEQFRAISEMGQRVTSILDVDELLTQTARLIQDAFGYYHVHIGLIEDDVVVLPASAGVWEGEANCEHCASLSLRVGQEAICSVVAGTGEPMIVPVISQEPRYLHPRGATGSGVVVPLKVKGQVIGLLDVESRQENAFDESDVAVLQSLANQVAVAIENARLYEQAQRLAALQERQKLARDLHDSVSQALYGLALGTRTARTLLDRDPARAAEPLDYCLSLAEAGLAEMRALIFELRPESLENEGLVAAMTKQAAAVRARYSVDVETELCPEPDLPLSTKEALYRIAQEAMNNTVKHARAARLRLALRCEYGLLHLEIGDDGAGFDPLGQFPGHLGLKSMRERVERLQGSLEIESAPGQGTRVRVQVPVEQKPAVPGEAAGAP